MNVWECDDVQHQKKKAHRGHGGEAEYPGANEVNTSQDLFQYYKW